MGAFFLEAVIETAEKGKTTFHNILKLHINIDNELTKLGKRTDNARKLLMHLYQSPVVNVRQVESILGIKYYKNNQKLYYQDLGEIFKPNPLAYKQYKSAIRTFNTSALVLCLGGGFIAGGTIMSYEPVLYGGEPDWTMALIGVGFVGVSIPLFVITKQRILKSISTYNNGISIHNSPEISDIKVHVNDIGIGVVVSF